MSTNRPSRVSHTSTIEATTTSTSKIQTQAQLLAVAAAKKKAESVLAKRAIQLFDYIAASDIRDAEKRRTELSEHYKKQYELLNIATADLEKRRQDTLDYEQQCKRDLIARRKRALTAIHSPSVKVHLVPCKDAGTSNDPIGKRVSSAAAISSSKPVARHSKARAKSGGCLSTLSETAALLQTVSAAAMLPQSGSSNRIGGSLVQIVSSSVPEEGVREPVQPLLQTPPTIDTSKYMPGPSFAQISFEARKASTASSIQAGRTSQYPSKSARPSTTSLSFLGTMTPSPSKRQPMFRGSAYRKQVQTVAEQRNEFTRTIVPVSKRYDARAHAEQDASSAAPTRRQACSAYASYGGRAATRRGEGGNECERGLTTARTIAALKLKYEQQTSDEKVEPEPVSIDAVQNSVFQRLSQKKHMLVMAVKNRKRASKLKIAVPLDRSSIITPPPPQRRMSSAHPVDASTDAFAAESSADMEDFFEEDEEEDVTVESEQGTAKVVDDEEHWRDPKIVALLGIVNERVGDSRRGRAILAERPKTVDATYSRRGADVRTVEQPPRSISVAQDVTRTIPEGSGRANSRQTSATEEALSEEVNVTPPSSAPASKSILRENRGASAGWRVTFEMSKSAPEPSNTNSADHNSRDNDQAEIQLPLPQTTCTHETATVEKGYKQMGSNPKWQPLGLRALDDFRKTLLPSTMTRPAKINDIAVAVEERVLLPNIMRVWVTPDIKD
ncbi:hypothetical protein BJ741DRAFT_661711 [Chytriomyces cf. hyalinus JEL632]|nr:hypothetical protein BJ741DRAFT_661711 [Chytriomyces cf. hyalinus JEL632]